MKRHLDTEIIYDKNGKPIPQYLDVNDKSGGTDGTMKPITGDNGAQNIQLTGSYVEYDVSNEFGTIPAGTNKQVNIIVPDGMTKFVLAARVYGIVSEVRYGSSIGGFAPNWSFYKRITENEVFLIGPYGASDGKNWANLITKKLDLLSSRLIISLTASTDGDVSPSMGNGAGIKIYFWRE